jgi:hypothetical protein
VLSDNILVVVDSPKRYGKMVNHIAFGRWNCFE